MHSGCLLMPWLHSSQYVLMHTLNQKSHQHRHVTTRERKLSLCWLTVLKVAQTKRACSSELNWTRMPTTSALSLALLPPLFPLSSFPHSFTACVPPVPFHPPLFSRSASGPDPVGVLLGKHETVFANSAELGLHNYTKSEYYKHDTVHFLGSFTAL